MFIIKKLSLPFSRCLDKSGGALQFSPDKCCQVILACARMHNFCIDLRVPEPAEMVPLDGDEDLVAQAQGPNDGNRRRIIAMFDQ